MTKGIETAEEARAHILEAIEINGRELVLGAVVDFNNTTENDINDKGDVWVCNPQTGHWMDEDRLVEFAKFLA